MQVTGTGKYSNYYDYYTKKRNVFGENVFVVTNI